MHRSMPCVSACNVSVYMALPRFCSCSGCSQLSRVWPGRRNKVDFCEDIREQYKEMRDEFMAGLEDRKYLTIDQVRNKAFQVTGALQTTEPEQT